MSYLTPDFLLSNLSSKSLYFDYAKDMPIFDYHCHLSEKEILEDKPFDNMESLWLDHDHYKWRLMRAHGINEDLITGNEDKEKKFTAYCDAISTAFGNPLCQWSQLELETYFHCNLEITKENALKIYSYCNDYLKKNNVRPSTLIESSKVTHLFTTNEVFDDLTTFEKIQDKHYSFKVIPAFREDKMLNLETKEYLSYLSLLEKETFPIHSLDDFEKALKERFRLFLLHGTKATDLSLSRIYEIPTKEMANQIFEKRLAGSSLTKKEIESFKGYMTYFFLHLAGEANIVAELHLGVMRNNNTKEMKALGPDTGFDAVSEEEGLTSLRNLFDRLNQEGVLPKTIVFNLNSKTNEELVTLLGCYQGTVPGKMQYGPAWWFLDNEDGIRKQLKDFAENGDLSTFVGMLTDSRSFLSYPRHHYFRRILCDYLGTLMETGRITKDMNRVGKVVQNICYNNAISYFDIKD